MKNNFHKYSILGSKGKMLPQNFQKEHFLQDFSAH